MHRKHQVVSTQLMNMSTVHCVVKLSCWHNLLNSSVYTECGKLATQRSICRKDAAAPPHAHTYTLPCFAPLLCINGRSPAHLSIYHNPSHDGMAAHMNISLPHKWQKNKQESLANAKVSARQLGVHDAFSSKVACFPYPILV